MSDERGDEPREPVGHEPQRPPDPDPSVDWQPDPRHADEWRAISREVSKEHRPRREDVYPYLLVRAFSPGDRGQRPLWPPTVCWESPDILLIDATWSGDFDPAQLVVSPVAGRSYRVFVRVWNLGLFPAVGVHVKAWAVNAGFFGGGDPNDPYYQQNLIGGRMVTQLEDRTRPGCRALVELDQPWRIEPNEIGHYCLIASVTCPADHFAGPLDVNAHRHVGQRNLNILAGQANAKELLSRLCDLVPKGFTLELTHGGPAALPLLHALGGGVMPIGDDRHRDIVAPALDEIRMGVNIGSSVHLLTAFSWDGSTVVARSDALDQLVRRTRHGRRAPGGDNGASAHPFAEAGGTRRLLDKLGPERWSEVATVTGAPFAVAVLEAIAQLLDADDFDAASMARGLGGPEGAQHLLRLTVTSPEAELIGGYSLVVG
jgi:hypothetical protein